MLTCLCTFYRYTSINAYRVFETACRLRGHIRNGAISCWAAYIHGGHDDRNASPNVFLFLKRAMHGLIAAISCIFSNKLLKILVWRATHTGVKSNRRTVRSTHTGNFSYHHRVLMRQSVMTQSGVVES
jgi:hypothetical protein